MWHAPPYNPHAQINIFPRTAHENSLSLVHSFPYTIMDNFLSGFRRPPPQSRVGISPNWLRFEIWLRAIHLRRTWRILFPTFFSPQSPQHLPSKFSAMFSLPFPRTSACSNDRHTINQNPLKRLLNPASREIPFRWTRRRCKLCAEKFRRTMIRILCKYAFFALYFISIK